MRLCVNADGVTILSFTIESDPHENYLHANIDREILTFYIHV
jgi:hypothetical protein